MKTAWTKGLTGERREEMEREFDSSALLRSRLTSLLEEKIDTNRLTARGVKCYENPAWPYLQADARGYERALYEIISLISSRTVENE